MKWQADMAANPLPTHNHPFDNKIFDSGCARCSRALRVCYYAFCYGWHAVFPQLNDFIIHPLTNF